MTKGQCPSAREQESTGGRVYDLAERTARFGEAVIDFVQEVPRSAVTNPLVSQLVRSATSVGANYVEADDADSRADFCYKIGLCKREARESVHWLRMLGRAWPDGCAKAQPLSAESHELVLIFASIVRKLKASALSARADVGH